MPGKKRAIVSPRRRPVKAAKVARKPVRSKAPRPARRKAVKAVKAAKGVSLKGISKNVAKAAPAKKSGQAGSKDLSLKLVQKKPNKGPPGAEAWKKVDRVDRELKVFEKAHNDSGAAPAKIRKQDEHVGLKHIKTEIERNIRGASVKDAKAEEPSKTDKTGISKNLIKSAVRTISGKQTFIKSGIRGLDEIMGGGLPKDSIILLSGTCGTGKSIFGMNFLIEGAMKGEPGIYISLEESPESNIKQMKLFGWPVDDMIKNKKLMILQPELYNFDALLTTIEDSIDRIKAKRLVIDAISIIGMYFEDPYKVRKSILQLGALLKKMKCTTIAIDEVREGEPSLSAYGVEEFVVDGVIVLYLIKRSNIYLRAAVIRKMRGVNHSTKIHPMEIKSPGGIVIYPSQELFEEVS
jgi:KaiC/GvpD/RAD55 family RecA-like ATPase